MQTRPILYEPRTLTINSHSVRTLYQPHHGSIFLRSGRKGTQPHDSSYFVLAPKTNQNLGYGWGLGMSFFGAHKWVVTTLLAQGDGTAVVFVLSQSAIFRRDQVGYSIYALHGWLLPTMEDSQCGHCFNSTGGNTLEGQVCIQYWIRMIYVQT
jgi:hypothetical protein